MEKHQQAILFSSPATGRATKGGHASAHPERSDFGRRGCRAKSASQFCTGGSWQTLCWPVHLFTPPIRRALRSLSTGTERRSLWLFLRICIFHFSKVRPRPLAPGLAACSLVSRREHKLTFSPPRRGIRKFIFINSEWASDPPHQTPPSRPSLLQQL